MLSLSVAWKWFDMTLAMALAFFGMLRPGDLHHLTWASLLLPHQLLSSVRCLFVRVGLPKMRRLGARREHIRIDTPCIIDLAEALGKLSDFSGPIVNGGAK